jgi:hypothetical protein
VAFTHFTPFCRPSIVSSPTAQVTQVNPRTLYDTVVVWPERAATSTAARVPALAKVII